MYEIALYLTDEEIDQALAHQYEMREFPGLYWDPVPADEEGYCPLGRAFEESIHDSILHHLEDPRRPIPNDVCAILVALGRITDWTTDGGVWAMAFAFAADWDKGLITNLAEALGRGGA